MKKILVILGRYFPKPSPNTLCVQNIIDLFPKEEYEVDVIGYDDGLKTSNGYNVTKIKRGLIQSLLYKFEDKTDALSKRIISLLMWFKRIKIVFFIPVWPWVDPIVTHQEYKIAQKMFQQNRYDTVISVYMPLSSLIVGHKLKQQYTDTRFIAYFLDSLSGGYVPHFMKKSTYNKKAVKWEKRLLNNADTIIFMESSRDYHQEVYQNSTLAEKIVYLDLPVLKKQNIVNKEQSKEILFVYVGSIALNMRSPEYFLKLFSQIKNDNWKAVFIGESNCALLNDYAKTDSRIKVVGKCSHEDALNYESKATVLLNLGNKNPNLAPSKIFEYMSWGKKIVSTYSISNDTSIKYLNKYPAALLLDERDEDFEKSADVLKNFVETKMEDVPYEKLEKIFWQNTPEAFVELLKEKTLK